jgi:MFS family permease
VLLILADFVLAWADSPLSVLLGVALWGLHMGCTQGILAAMIAEVAPKELKGTAFGLFNLASGLFMLLVSFIAGGLWDRYGSGNNLLRRSGIFASRLGHAHFAREAPSGLRKMQNEMDQRRIHVHR